MPLEIDFSKLLTLVGLKSGKLFSNSFKFQALICHCHYHLLQVETFSELSGWQIKKKYHILLVYDSSMNRIKVFKTKFQWYDYNLKIIYLK